MNGMTDETTDKTTKGTAMDDETTMAMPAAGVTDRGEQTTMAMPVVSGAGDEATVAMPAAGSVGDEATVGMPVVSDAGDDTTVAMPAAAPDRGEESTAAMPAVPLYATQPPAGAGTAGDLGAGDAGHGAAGPQAAAGATPFGPRPDQPFVQVAPQPKPEPLRKTGPSVPTIVLGVLGILLGLVVLGFGLGFPEITYGLADWIIASATPGAFLALSVGGLGVLLLVIAAVWGVARAVRGHRNQDGEVGGATGDAAD